MRPDSLFDPAEDGQEPDGSGTDAAAGPDDTGEADGLRDGGNGSGQA